VIEQIKNLPSTLAGASDLPGGLENPVPKVYFL